MNIKRYFISLALCGSSLLLTSCKTVLGDYASTGVDENGNNFERFLTLKIDNSCSYLGITYLANGDTRTHKPNHCTWDRRESSIYKNLIFVIMQNEFIPQNVDYIYSTLMEDGSLHDYKKDVYYYKT